MISLLQWNICYKEDLVNIAAFLKPQQPDIICLQELTAKADPVHGSDAASFIAQQLGYNFYASQLPDDADPDENLVNGIFSCFPITNQSTTWINQPRGTGGYDDEYRSYAEVTLDIQGKSLRVGTTHMSYTHRFESTSRKEQEADNLVQAIQEHTGSFILAGDFNAAPDSYTIKRISQYLQNIGSDLSQNTWTTKPFSYQGFDETELNWRLDYIFGTKDIKVIAAEVLQTEYSDHLPVLIKIEV